MAGGVSPSGRPWADRLYWSVTVQELGEAELEVSLVGLTWRGRVPTERWRECSRVIRLGSGPLGPDEVLEAVASACASMMVR